MTLYAYLFKPTPTYLSLTLQIVQNSAKNIRKTLYNLLLREQGSTKLVGEPIGPHPIGKFKIDQLVIYQ